MNTYQAKFDNRVVATTTDDPNLHVLIMDIVELCMQHGLWVTIQSGAPATMLAAVPAVKPVKPAKPARRVPIPPIPPMAPITELAGWTLGARAYLAWSNLTDTARVHLSQYRTAPGKVEQFRRGSGVLKSIAVRFNEDPELIWLRPVEIAAAPEVG